MSYPRSSLELYLNSYAQNILFKILGKVFEGETSEKKKQGFREIVSFYRVWWYPPIILALGKQRQKN